MSQSTFTGTIMHGLSLIILAVLSINSIDEYEMGAPDTSLFQLKIKGYYGYNSYCNSKEDK